MQRKKQKDPNQVYEYDSDEEVEGGTWEHKKRAEEMRATLGKYEIQLSPCVIQCTLSYLNLAYLTPHPDCTKLMIFSVRGKLSFYWSSERHSELSPPRKECK